MAFTAADRLTSNDVGDQNQKTKENAVIANLARQAYDQPSSLTKAQNTSTTMADKLVKSGELPALSLDYSSSDTNTNSSTGTVTNKDFVGHANYEAKQALLDANSGNVPGTVAEIKNSITNLGGETDVLTNTALQAKLAEQALNKGDTKTAEQALSKGILELRGSDFNTGVRADFDKAFFALQAGDKGTAAVGLTAAETDLADRTQRTQNAATDMLNSLNMFNSKNETAGKNDISSAQQALDLTKPNSGGGSGGSGGSGDEAGFTVSEGKFLINGKPMNGVNVDSRYAEKIGPQALAAQIAKDFPGINVVRFATSPYGGINTNGQPYAKGSWDGNYNESIADVNKVIQAFNAKGIGVIVDNHNSAAQVGNNISEDGNEAAWFAQLAKDNMGNKMVMFQPENEPTSTDWHTGRNNTAADLAVANEQQAVYNAIRATGSQAIVAFEQEHGVSDQAAPFQAAASTFDKDYNYVIDAHLYGDPSAINSDLHGTSFLREANGEAVPVFFGETGNSGNGLTVDSNGAAVTKDVWNTGVGAIAWEYDPLKSSTFGLADNMTYSESSTLTSYGQEVAALIKQAASE